VYYEVRVGLSRAINNEDSNICRKQSVPNEAKVRPSGAYCRATARNSKYAIAGLWVNRTRRGAGERVRGTPKRLSVGYTTPL